MAHMLDLVQDHQCGRLSRSCAQAGVSNAYQSIKAQILIVTLDMITWRRMAPLHRHADKHYPDHSSNDDCRKQQPQGPGDDPLSSDLIALLSFQGNRVCWYLPAAGSSLLCLGLVI